MEFRSVAKPSKAVSQPRRHRVDLYICLLLAAVTLGVYAQVTGFDFLNYDDPIYVDNNPIVRGGLTAKGIAWAFGSFYAANWFPLTWLSHMADCQWFGMRAGWHHLSSVFLHTAASLLLFAALKRLTGARWPSAFVAFVFALHPLHVESVAWVAERKDVLCAFFWFLTLYLYAAYARRPNLSSYLLVLGAFTLGLLSKSMIVTLPFVLLLLDYWPLRRALRPALIREKLPLFALSAASAVVTFLAQQHGSAVRSLTNISLGLRIENAVVAYAAYIRRMFWPVDLAVFYPYRFGIPVWEIAISAALLISITILVIRQSPPRPYLAVGWLWYLGTLVPVIGLVQVGAQSSADRYTYIPLVGLAIMLAWGGADLLRRQLQLRTALAVSAIVVCIVMTRLLLPYWTDSATLFQRAADVTSGNYLAHNNLAEYYLDHNQIQLAALHVQAALRIRPAYPEAHANFALIYQRVGRAVDAEREFDEAIRLRPNDPAMRRSFGFLLLSRGRLADAIQQFRAEAQLAPGDAASHYTLGNLLLSTGQFEEAAAELSAALRIEPAYPGARDKLLLAQQHRRN